MVGIKAYKSAITTEPLPTEQKIANLVQQIEGLERLCSKQTVRIQMLEADVKSRDGLIDRYERMIDDHCADMKNKDKRGEDE